MDFIKDFGVWDSSIHEHYEQAKRIKTGKKDIFPFVLYEDKKTAQFEGSGGNTYDTTLDSCTCGDFLKRKLPCKHIYCLANALGYIGGLPVLDEQAVACFDVNAEIARYRNLYLSGAISVDKYSKIADALAKGK